MCWGTCGVRTVGLLSRWVLGQTQDVGLGLCLLSRLAGPHCMFCTDSGSVTIRSWFRDNFLVDITQHYLNMAFASHWESSLCVP